MGKISKNELSESLKLEIENAGAEIVNDFSGGVDKVASAELAKTLNTNLSTTNAQLAQHTNDLSPHAETVNKTISVGSGKMFATIQSAINSLKKRIEANIVINVDAGTYTEDVAIKGFVGGGTLVINGANSTAGASSYILNKIIIKGCSCPVAVNGFKATSTGKCFELLGSSAVGLLYCVSDTASAVAGVYVESCIGVYLYGLEMSNKNIAISCVTSVVASASHLAGTGNALGLKAEVGTTIGKDGTQPSGGTAELATTGGRIA